MKKRIAEDLPARSHPQAQMSSQNKGPQDRGGSDRGGDDKGGEKTPEQRIRQAVYDIRYRARRERLPLRTAYSQYMQNSSMGEQEKAEVRKKLFGAEGGSGGGSPAGGAGSSMRAEDFEHDIKESATDAMAKALYQVFVKKPSDTVTEDSLQEMKNEFNKTAEGRKYKVRVHDKESGVTYVRYATRQKISELRARGLDVEMTEYGDPYEGEKAKKDYDGDGKIESPAKEHAGAVHNAIQRKKGGIPDGKDTSSVKESYLSEISTMANLPQTDPQNANPDANRSQLDIRNCKNKVDVNPNDSSTMRLNAHREIEGNPLMETGYSKFLEMLQEKKMTKAKKKKENKLKKKYYKSGMKKSMMKQYGPEKGEKVYFATIRKQAMGESSECGCDETKDRRGLPTRESLLKTKLQSMGMKNLPPVMIALNPKDNK